MQCFCPCVQVGQTAEKAELGSCVTCCLAYYCINVCCCFSAWLRGQIQEKTGYDNSGMFVNWCTHLFCHCCANTQEARAVKAQTGAPAEETMER